MAVTMVLLAVALLAWPAAPGRPVLGGATGGIRGVRIGPDPGAVGLPVRAAQRSPIRRVLPAVMQRMRGIAAGTAVARGHGRLGLVGVAVAAGLVTALVVTVPCGLAAGVATGTVTHLARRARRTGRARRERDACAVVLRGLARDLRAGTMPSAAVAEASRTAEPRVAAALPRAGPGAPSAGIDPGLTEVRTRLMTGWQLTARHGIPLAEVVTAIAEDLADRSSADQARTAQVAGPAVSGYVLAGLPLAGLLLGAGMGADPLAVLTGSTVGGILLVAGTLLCCCGLLWADRIVRR